MASSFFFFFLRRNIERRTNDKTEAAFPRFLSEVGKKRGRERRGEIKKERKKRTKK